LTIIFIITGVDLSKIVGAQTKIWGEEVVTTDESMDASQLLGARSWAGPNFYAYCYYNVLI